MKASWWCRIAVSALVFGLGAGSAVAQVTMLESTAWAPVPAEGLAPMGAFDEQQVPIANGPNPAGPGCILVAPPFLAPPGMCGPTLWHTEANCCAVGGVFALPMTSPVAAYNQGDLVAPLFNYLTPNAAGTSVRNQGALSSVGLRGVPIRTSPIPLPPQQIVLSFDTIRATEPDVTGAFDEAWVEARPAPCGEPACLDPAAGAAWAGFLKIVAIQDCMTPVTCTVGPGHPVLDATFIGSDGKIRFRFDTIDGLSNAYCGWMVDNVRLTNEKCDPPCGPGAAFQPQIGSIGGMPRPGNAGFALTLSAAPPASPTLLVIGIQKNFLPIPALGLPSPGCTLCCDPMFILATPPTNAAGNSMVPIPIPAGLAPCATVCAQWVVLSLGGGAISILTSSKGDISIQP